jgi:hypothetical protein
MSNLPSYEDLENAVLNAVTAIHCLTVERNNLRSCADAQETQLASLRDANEHLRRQLVLIGYSYMNYASCSTSPLHDVAGGMQAAECDHSTEATGKSAVR